MRVRIRDAALLHGIRLLHRAGWLRTAGRLTPAELSGVRGVLLVVTTALGDAINMTPIYQAVRDRFPGARVVGFFHEAYAELFEGDPRFDAIVRYRGKYRGVRTTIRALRRAGCDLALIANANDPDVIPLVVFGGARVIVRMPGRDTVYRFLVANPEQLHRPSLPDHTLDRAQKIVEAVGGEIREPRYHLAVTEESRQRVQAWLKEAGILPGQVLVGFHPGASVREKMWPAVRYAELARALFRAEAAPAIVLTGSGRERGLCEEIRAGSGTPGRVINAAGALPMRDLPALLTREAVLVSGDTGLYHMAVAIGCRTVTIFIQSSPDLTGPPYDLERHLVVRRPGACDACARSCRYPACAAEVSAAEVSDRVLSLLGQGASVP